KQAPEDEIYRLGDTFNHMFDKLERTFEEEKQFTSDVSHELRTPLAVIISQSDYGLEDESYRQQALEVINREARRMSGLVNRLLTLARSDAGRLKMERGQVDLSALCESIIQQQATVAAERGFEVVSEIQPDVKVLGDETMLIRVILNLMENALKYGKRQAADAGVSPVILRLERQGRFARLSVADRGQGIAVKDLERIWERFYRADHSRSDEGAGLGLSMVKALVKAHGGKVELESAPGEGSCFTVTLPLEDGETWVKTDKEKRT
ncbi:MAG: HAMP domain-containing sensor histidine kinase, partial [Bacillota bacterium]|nr:HAMP domain-containing sensor histidine kinase [Bacillota bacterium]